MPKAKSKVKKITQIKDLASKPGPKPMVIDAEQIFKLALIHCTVDEIATVVKCSRETIYKRFAHEVQRGHEEGQMSLKRKMHEVAMAGDTKMLIWLSKQRLGYKDQMPIEATQINFNVFCREIPKLAEATYILPPPVDADDNK